MCHCSRDEGKTPALRIPGTLCFRGFLIPCYDHAVSKDAVRKMRAWQRLGRDRAAETPISLTTQAVRAIADRKTGVGFDQMILIEGSTNGADAVMRILNPDGGEVEACGNAARCVGQVLMGQIGRDRVTIDTQGGRIQARAGKNGLVTVDMGLVRTDWQEIPLASEQDTIAVEIGIGQLQTATCINVGNPHAVFFVEDAEAIDLDTLGPEVEHHPMFPDRINVEAVHITADGAIRMRVWERGVGITRACGPGPVRFGSAAARTGRTGREAPVVLDGGTLHIAWPEDGPDAGHVLMTGPVAHSFSGILSGDLLAQS